MRCNDEVIERKQFLILFRRFCLQYVHTCPGDFSGADRSGECIGVYNTATCGVNQIRRRFHCPKFRLSKHPLRFRCQWCVDSDEIRGREEF